MCITVTRPCYKRHCRHITLDRPHTTRFVSCDGLDRIRYETTHNHRGSCHLMEIDSPSHTTRLISRDCVFLRVTQSLKYLWTYSKSNDFFNSDRRNHRGPHNERCLVWFGLIHYSAFSAAKAYDTLLRYPTLTIDPRRSFKCISPWTVLPNSYPSALRAMQRGSLYHFYDGLWYDPIGRRTHDLPCERRKR